VESVKKEIHRNISLRIGEAHELDLEDKLLFLAIDEEGNEVFKVLSIDCPDRFIMAETYLKLFCAVNKITMYTVSYYSHETASQKDGFYCIYKDREKEGMVSLNKGDELSLEGEIDFLLSPYRAQFSNLISLKLNNEALKCAQKTFELFNFDELNIHNLKIPVSS
jgi:hypothetical protein